MMTRQELGILIFKVLFEGRGNARKYVMDCLGEKPSPEQFDAIVFDAIGDVGIVEDAQDQFRNRQ